MGPGTSSDILVILYVAIAATLLIVAVGFGARRSGRWRGRRAGLVFACACVLPMLVGLIAFGGASV
ncbi:hypothetical protein [Sphingomonas sp.]|jgi:hypothetical protein|uniref:hypothetical protein n=1 Tax=Sphingomonas sp. TaxID=28214 RepID=UPI002EDA5B65